MNRNKSKQDRQAIVGKKAFNLVVSALALINLPISQSYNAKYGLPHAAAILFKMCSARVTANTAVDLIENHIPTPQWFLGLIRKIGERATIGAGDAMLTGSVGDYERTKGRKRGPVTIAIDKHLISRYDKTRRILSKLVRSIAKKGTTWFEAYATMQIIGGPILRCIPVTLDISNSEIVRRFLQSCREQGLRTRVFLLDREFFSVDVMAEIKSARKKFLMPARKTDGIKKAIIEYTEGKRKAISSYTMKNAHGRTFTFQLVIVRNKSAKKEDKITDKYHVFATNVNTRSPLWTLKTISGTYRQRWGIETTYRQNEEVRPRTTSRNRSVRLLLFYITLILYNTWAANRPAEKKKGTTLKKMISMVFKNALAACIVGIYKPV